MIFLPTSQEALTKQLFYLQVNPPLKYWDRNIMMHLWNLWQIEAELIYFTISSA